MPETPLPPTQSAGELEARLYAAFPAGRPDARMTVADITASTIRLVRTVSDVDLRPGATVSGPTLMTLADTAAWLLTLAQLPAGVDAVTADLTIHFLRRPPLAELVADGRLLRMGRRVSVVDVAIRSAGASPGDEVAHSVVTYAPLLP